MVDDDLAWDDEHPTLQQIPKPTGWETQIEERPLDEDLIATVQAQRIDVRYQLDQTKRRLRLMTLAAAAAFAACLALGLTLWSRPSSSVTSAAQPPAPKPSPAEAETVPAVAKPEAKPATPVPAQSPEAAPAEETEVRDLDEPVAAEDASDEAAPTFGISATGDGITMFVDGVKKGTLPLTVSDVTPGVHDVRFEGPAGRIRVVQIELSKEQHLDLGTIAFDQSKVQVVISLSTPRTVVLLKPEGGTQRQLTGPWPMSLELDPGTYSLVGARRGRQTYARPLVLDLERPYREINIRLRR